MRDEQRPERGKGHHNDRNGSFNGVPEEDPRGVDSAVAGVSASNLDDGDDHCADTEAENAAQGEFAAEGDADVPEEDDWD